MREWRTIDASTDLMSFGKLRAQLARGDVAGASKVVAEQIANYSKILKDAESEMGPKEKYYARGAAFTLETGLYPNEQFSDAKQH